MRLVHQILVFGKGLGCRGFQVLIVVSGRCIFAFQDAILVFVDHSDGPVKQVSQVICQIKVDLVDKIFRTEHAIVAKWHRLQQVVARSIQAIAINQRFWIDHVAFGLAHLAIFHRQPAVTNDVLWQWQSQRMQHDWPVDGVEPYDFFTNHVHIGWPVFLKQAVVIAAIAQCRNIVGQGIDPDVNDVLRVIWYLNTPVKRGPRNG